MASLQEVALGCLAWDGGGGLCCRSGKSLMADKWCMVPVSSWTKCGMAKESRQEQVQCARIQAACGALDNSIFWVLKAWLGSAVTGQGAWEKGPGRC